MSLLSQPETFAEIKGGVTLRSIHRAAGAAATLLAAISFGTGRAAAAGCDSLAGIKLGKAIVTAAGSVSGSFGIMNWVPPLLTSVSVPFCRVEGTISPTADSDIRFELWLPPPSAWNGKYEGVGNGGFAGFITYIPMDWALEAGYAVSGTDTGHDAAVIDARWAVGHPEKVVDFGWRAIHETAVASKAIVQAYYGRAATHAYFAGCSNGGREALMEAQRFPDDYDGIVAGAPANYWTGLMANAAWDQQALTAEPGARSPPGSCRRSAPQCSRPVTARMEFWTIQASAGSTLRSCCARVPSSIPV